MKLGLLAKVLIISLVVTLIGVVAVFWSSSRLFADAYVDALRECYKGRVPGGADLVTYWFEKARAQIEAGKCTSSWAMGRYSFTVMPRDWVSGWTTRSYAAASHPGRLPPLFFALPMRRAMPRWCR